MNSESRTQIIRGALLALVLILPVAAVANEPDRLTDLTTLETLDERQPLSAEGCNRALHFRVNAAELVEDYQGRAAPPGQRWLVLDLEVENRMPSDLMFDLEYPEAILIASLTRQFYLLIDGQQVVRRASFEPVPADAMADGFVLQSFGRTVSGRLAYPVPDSGVETLSLHYYHDDFAPVVVTLMGDRATDMSTPNDPDIALQSNDLMQIALHSTTFEPEWHGQSAPEGMEWLIVDLRGLGLWSIEADALALDRDAAPERKIELPKVIEYVEAQGLLQVVVDGEHGYTRDLGLSSIPDEPAFLPDVFAGGNAVFPVPLDAQSLALEVHFPEFRGPGIDNPIPDTMIFAIRGEPVAPDTIRGAPDRQEPLALIEDEPIPFTLLGLERRDIFAGHRAAQGETLLVVDASMHNTSPVGGMMNVASRIEMVDDQGDAIEYLGTFNPGPLTLAEPFWLPVGGAPRRFKLVYRMAVDARPAELAYGGISVNTSVTLPDE